LIPMTNPQKITIDFTGLNTLVNDIFYPLFQNEQRYVNLVGGAGSGKSVFAAQKIVKRIVKEKGHKIAIFRRIAKTLKGSCFEEVLGIIHDWNLSKLFKVNLSDLTITFIPNGNRVVFLGLDDQEKLKSVRGITSIWIEEATELLPKDFEQIDLRLRGKTKWYKQIILTYNPISHLHWLKPKFFDVTPERCAGQDDRYKITGNALTLHTTYQDNRFIDDEYRTVLNGLRGNARKVYKLGEWGILEGLIYEPAIMDVYPKYFNETIRGLDFGFNNAMALIRLDLKDGEAYVTEEFYNTGYTTNDLIKWMNDHHIDDREPIYADSAEPDRIEEIARAGYNIVPADKGPGSVMAGIDLCQTIKTHTKPENVNYNAERNMYQWRVDRNGKSMDEPMKENDHGQDAFRYALWSHLGKPQPAFSIM